VPGSSRVRPLTPDLPPILGTPCLKKKKSHQFVLKINRSKFTHGLEPLYGDARSAKSFEVLTLVFSADRSPIEWLQSVIKITRFEQLFFFSFLKIRRHVRVGLKLD
jgi:hypothetical protein